MLTPHKVVKFVHVQYTRRYHETTCVAWTVSTFWTVAPFSTFDAIPWKISAF